MDIKVRSTGTSSKLPDRLVVSLTIKATGKTVEEAKWRQQSRLCAIQGTLQEHNVEFKFLSSPSVHEITHKEEKTEEGTGAKTTRMIVDSYGYFQTAEIVLDGWEVGAITEFLSPLIVSCEGNLYSRFELTEVQKSEMSAEALESSFRTAVVYAQKIASLGFEGLMNGTKYSLQLRESVVVANDYGVGAMESEGAVYKRSAVSQDSLIQYSPLAVKKPISITNTVEYIFEAR